MEPFHRQMSIASLKRADTMKIFGFKLTLTKSVNRNCYYEKGCGNRVGKCLLYDPTECKNYTPKNPKQIRISIWKNLLWKK